MSFVKKYRNKNPMSAYKLGKLKAYKVLKTDLARMSIPEVKKMASKSHDVFDKRMYKAYKLGNKGEYDYNRGLAMVFGTFAHTGEFLNERKIK